MIETYLFSTFIRWDFYFQVICKLICKWNYLTLLKVLGFWINLINKNFQRVDKKNILFNEKNTIVSKLSKILEFKSLLTLIFWTNVYLSSSWPNYVLASRAIPTLWQQRGRGRSNSSPRVRICQTLSALEGLKIILEKKFKAFHS